MRCGLVAAAEQPGGPARPTWESSADPQELLGLVASLVLRCDDCISYHVARCREAGVARDEMFEAFSAGLVVGGSIVIPHMRRAFDFLDKLEQGESAVPATHDHA